MKRLTRCGGYTYLGLMVMLLLFSIAAAATLQAGAALQRRAAEQELLFIGAALRSALISYANATPVGQRRSPRSVQELLRDPRYPNPRRHLRRFPVDPLTGSEEWGIVDMPDGSGVPGIVGFYSLSDETPIKRANFDPEFAWFANSASYRDWVFTSQAMPTQIKPATNPFQP